MRTEFARLTRDTPCIDASLTAFRAYAYKYKEIVDYGVGRSLALCAKDAEDIVAAAERFVISIGRALGRA